MPHGIGYRVCVGLTSLLLSCTAPNHGNPNPKWPKEEKEKASTASDHELSQWYFFRGNWRVVTGKRWRFAEIEPQDNTDLAELLSSGIDKISLALLREEICEVTGVLEKRQNVEIAISYDRGEGPLNSEQLTCLRRIKPELLSFDLYQYDEDIKLSAPIAVRGVGVGGDGAIGLLPPTIRVLGSMGMGDHLDRFHRLEELYLGAGTDSSLKAVRLLKRLRVLRLNSGGQGSVSDQGIEHIASLPSLEVLDATSTDIGDKALLALSRAPSLRVLLLGGTKLGNAGALQLVVHKNLTELALNQTSVGNVGLAGIKNLRNLKRLYLSRTKVSDSGLAKLSKLSKLEILDLTVTNVGDAGVREVSKLLNLRWLSLAGSKITTVAELSDLNKLEFLNVAGTNVGDDSVHSLIGLKRLRHLDLGHTGVSDASIPRLSELKWLEHLDLNGAKVTKQGSERLKESLQNTNVRWCCMK